MTLSLKEVFIIEDIYSNMIVYGVLDEYYHVDLMVRADYNPCQLEAL